MYCCSCPAFAFTPRCDRRVSLTPQLLDRVYMLLAASAGAGLARELYHAESLLTTPSLLASVSLVLLAGRLYSRYWAAKTSIDHRASRRVSDRAHARDLACVSVLLDEACDAEIAEAV
jgi:hypothetical protein